MSPSSADEATTAGLARYPSPPMPTRSDGNVFGIRSLTVSERQDDDQAAKKVSKSVERRLVPWIRDF
jgi:hypothetical protein